MGQETHIGLNTFESFFKKNFQPACLIAYRYIDDRSVVEDLVQESFITLWEKRNEIKITTKLEAYLFATIRNRTISYLRGVKIKSVEIEKAILELKDANDETINKDEELAIRINKAIEKLAPKCKEIFLLAYVKKLSYQEIADQLSVSKNTVKTQMGIAYRILRQELKEFYLGFLILMSQKSF